MLLRQIERFYPLGQGKKAGHYVGQADVRCYVPPAGYSAIAELIELHPFTNQPLPQSEWWIFLTPEDLI